MRDTIDDMINTFMGESVYPSEPERAIEGAEEVGEG